MSGGRACVRRVRSDRADLWPEARPPLTWLDLELTERCNNDCVHCSVNRPAGDAAVRARELGTSEITRLLDDAAGLGCLTVRLTGGEPLLRGDFEEIYLFARKKGMRVLLFTNATLLTPRLAGLLARVPPREKVEVSIYGSTEAAYEAATRTPGSYAASRRGLALLAGNGVPFVIKSARLPASGDPKSFESWAASVSGQDRTDWAMYFDLRSRRDDGKNGLIRSLRAPAGEAARLVAAMSDEARAERVRFVARQGGPSGDRLFTCLSSGGRCAVDAYGTLQYCLALRHPETTYDLKRGSLAAALETHLPAVRSLAARDPAYVGRCGRCFLKALCLQCPAKSWAEHGTLDKPVEYFCDVAHAQGEALGLLGAGEKAWTVADGRARVARVAGPPEENVPDPLKDPDCQRGE